MTVAYIKERKAPTKNADTAILVTGSAWRSTLHMAWPLTLNMLALAALNIFEGWIAGRLGPDAQAAIGVGGQMWLLFMMMTLAMSAGTTSIISRFCGAGDLQFAVKAGQQALLCATVLSTGATIVGLLLCRTILHSLGASGAVEEKGFSFLTMCLISMVPYTVLWISNAIFRASGDARTPMVTMMIVFALTGLCELVLCMGPINLGVSGIGISWTLCSFVGIVRSYIKMKQSALSAICDVGAALSDGLSFGWAKRFLAIGIPTCIQDLAVIGGSMGVFWVLSKAPQSLVSQAAWAAGWRLEETLTLMPMYGLNLAAAAIVGQNLGARLPQRAASCGWMVMALGAAANVFVALGMYAFAPQIAASLCASEAVASSCTDYLRIVCWTEPFFASWRILSGAMQGAGYTVVPMYVTIFSFAILRPLLALVLLHLSHGNSLYVWASMAISTVFAGLIMIYFWHRSEWRY
jgi:putative efflux protein, MATE family